MLTFVYIDYGIRRAFNSGRMDELYDPDNTSITEDDEALYVTHGKTYLYGELITKVAFKGEIHYRYRDFCGPYHKLVNYLKSIHSYDEEHLKHVIDTIRLNAKRTANEIRGK